MIEHYEFGHIVIDGKGYSSDVIIYPDHVDSEWWREEGHRLSPADLWEVVQAKPEILVVGTGYSGLMEVPRETIRYLEENGIKVLVYQTREAWKVYNQLLREGKKVVAALHLTC